MCKLETMSDLFHDYHVFYDVTEDYFTELQL